MQCSAQHQAVQHHTESTDGAARHAGCSGPVRPSVTARKRRQGSVGQVRKCTGPAMQQHTYTQRAHNTHSPARLPVPVGRHPGHCLLVTAPSAHHTTPHHTTPHHTTPHHTTPHHTTPHQTTQHNTTPARVPGGSGHRRPGGQDHPDGNRVPRRLPNQGDDCHEGYHGGQRLGAGTPGVLPAPDALPSDTRLHRLLVALLGVQVQVNAPLHAQLWDDHHHVSLDQLRSAGVWVPTIVWMTAPPADAYWQWAQASPAPLVTVTTALPPWPWIAISPAAVAKFKQVPRGVCSAQVPATPEQRAPLPVL